MEPILEAVGGLEGKPIDASTVVIVLRVTNESGDRTVGICVDGVSDVHDVATDAIMVTPDVGSHTEDNCVSGLVTLEGKPVMLLDIDRLFGLRLEGTGDTTTLNG